MDLSPPLVVASLSGESDARWANLRSRYVGMVCLGGFSMDSSTRAASARMVGRGRKEFLSGGPERFLKYQLSKVSDPEVKVAVNVRSVTLKGLLGAARLAGQYGAAVEINAHCRQPEMLEIGCGQALLADPEKLNRYIKTVRDMDVDVGVKGRFEVEGVDAVDVLNGAVEAGADYLHVDAMDSEPLIAELEAPYLIANNGVRTRRHVEEYARYGADAVSVARSSEPAQLKALLPDVITVFAR